MIDSCTANVPGGLDGSPVARVDPADPTLFSTANLTPKVALGLEFSFHAHHYSLQALLYKRFPKRRRDLEMVCPDPGHSAILNLMNRPTIGESIQISACEPSQYSAALQIVFSDLPEPDRTAAIEGLANILQEDTLTRNSLSIALDRGTLVGAVWFQHLPGRTAILMPPRQAFRMNQPGHRIADRLIADVLGQLRSRGVILVQTLLRKEDTQDAQRFRSAGFEDLTDLVYLAAPTHSASQPRDTSLTFQPYRDDQRARLGQLIQQTYINSLDCPALDGLREIEDVISGYQATGVYDPGRWFFVRHENTDVGVLLLTSHAPAQPWELVYMGLVPDARGQGWGDWIARFALWQAKLGGADQVVLAVDVANTPVTRIYERVGFIPWDRRTVWIRRLSDDLVDPS
ncbi:MAG: GNAT family N-acetyltransferase [Pirellulales bacterium]|nr:GNAT family N-acetyltransferase [Pirellulales bacterium]